MRSMSQAAEQSSTTAPTVPPDDPARQHAFNCFRDCRPIHGHPLCRCFEARALEPRHDPPQHRQRRRPSARPLP